MFGCCRTDGLECQDMGALQLLKMQEIGKAAILPATQICLEHSYGGRSPKTFHHSSKQNFDSEPSPHIVSQIMVTLAINHIIVSIIYVKYIDFNDDFSMNYLAKFIEKCKILKKLCDMLSNCYLSLC